MAVNAGLLTQGLQQLFGNMVAPISPVDVAKVDEQIRANKAQEALSAKQLAAQQQAQNRAANLQQQELNLKTQEANQKARLGQGLAGAGPDAIYQQLMANGQVKEATAFRKQIFEEQKAMADMSQEQQKDRINKNAQIAAMAMGIQNPEDRKKFVEQIQNDPQTAGLGYVDDPIRNTYYLALADKQTPEMKGQAEAVQDISKQATLEQTANGQVPQEVPAEQGMQAGPTPQQTAAQTVLDAAKAKRDPNQIGVASIYKAREAADEKLSTLVSSLDDSIPRYQDALDALEAGYGGPGSKINATAQSAIKGFLTSMGIDAPVPTDWAEAQSLLDSAATKMWTDARQLIAGQGQVTEQESERISMLALQSMDPREAAKYKLNRAILVGKYLKAKKQFIDEMKEKYPNSPSQIDKRWEESAQQKDFQKQLSELTGSIVDKTSRPLSRDSLPPGAMGDNILEAAKKADGDANLGYMIVETGVGKDGNNRRPISFSQSSQDAAMKQLKELQGRAEGRNFKLMSVNKRNNELVFISSKR